MRTDALHRRVTRDIGVMMDAVSEVLPVRMPKRYEGHTLNLVAFVKRLNRATEQYSVFNEISPDLTMPVGSIVVSGLWLPEDDLPENESNADIRILWHAHPTTHQVSLSQMKWDRRRFFFWQRVGHELVHRHQDSIRPDTSAARTYRVQADEREVKEQQQYLGDYDELEAYAHDAALEFTLYPDMSLAAGVSAIKDMSGPIVPTYDYYLKTYEPNHPAVLPFKRKVRAWWEVMRKSTDFYAKLALPKLL